MSANVTPKKAVAEVFLRPILPQQNHVFQLFENKLNKLPVNSFVSQRQGSEVVNEFSFEMFILFVESYMSS